MALTTEADRETPGAGPDGSRGKGASQPHLEVSMYETVCVLAIALLVAMLVIDRLTRQ